ncbi:hypothetical protein ACFW3A_11650 [Streptomyces pilosus]|uniref:hypothetical protein n=1 Tax=Streptomyces pilosus TaxID=28893 RepID=UPI0036290002
MAWDEWEQAKAASVERHSAKTQLNQLPVDRGGAGPGGGGDRLRSDKAAWTKAGEGISSLRTDLGKALRKAETGQSGLDKDAGWRTSVAQKDVYDSWKRYAKDMGELCEALAQVLERTGDDQLRTDEAIKTEIARLRAEHYGTPTADDPAKGR